MAATIGLGLAALTVLGAMSATASTRSGEDLGDTLGALSVDPSSGVVTTSFNLVSSAPCPSGATNIVAFANNAAAGWSDVIMLSNTSNGVSTTDPMSVGVTNNLYNTANANSLPLPSGTYTISLRCQNRLASTVYGSFSGDVVVTAADSGTPPNAASTYTSTTGGATQTTTATETTTATSTATATATATSTPTPKPKVHLTATGPHSKKLGSDPKVTKGEKVTVVGTGFKGHEKVSVTLHSTPRHLTTLTASAHGHIRYHLTVPAHLSGKHHLTFTGAKSSRKGVWYFHLTSSSSKVIHAVNAADTHSAGLGGVGVGPALELGLVLLLALTGAALGVARRRPGGPTRRQH